MRRDRPAPVTLSRIDAGSLIREARELAGLSQAELAARVATTQPVVSRWEKGVDVPRADTLGRILQACGFEADLRFRRHDDVDRSQIRHALSLSPAERARAFEDTMSELLETRRLIQAGRGG
jgi:transcriptional regulator with XRE-family HTH domain